jgi:hypothetical protein
MDPTWRDNNQFPCNAHRLMGYGRHGFFESRLIDLKQSLSFHPALHRVSRRAGSSGIFFLTGEHDGSTAMHQCFRIAIRAWRIPCLPTVQVH